MSGEVLSPENSVNPNIINATVLIGNQEVLIPTIEGKAYRQGTVAQLGKRFACAQEIKIKTTSDVTDTQTNEIKTVTSETIQYLEGSVSSTDGERVYLGCGTEIMCLKPSPEKSVLFCCDIPMSLKQPQILPSAD